MNSSDERSTDVVPEKWRSRTCWQYPRNAISSTIGDTTEDMLTTSTIVSSGYFDGSSKALAGVLTNWKKTIQSPASAITENMPASNASAKIVPDAPLARSACFRASDVPRGHQRPPRYCQNSQSTRAITATDHGAVSGEFLKFVESSNPQIACPTNRMTNASSADQSTARKRRFCSMTMGERQTEEGILPRVQGRVPEIHPSHTKGAHRLCCTQVLPPIKSFAQRSNMGYGEAS